MQVVFPALALFRTGRVSRGLVLTGVWEGDASGDLGTSSWSLTPGVSMVNGPQFDREMQPWFMLIVIARTEWSPIQSVIILVINKSDSRFAVVRFWSSLVWLQSFSAFGTRLWNCLHLDWRKLTKRAFNRKIHKLLLTVLEIELCWRSFTDIEFKHKNWNEFN